MGLADWIARARGYRRFADTDLSAAGARLRSGGWVLGVNGGSHEAGAALVRVEAGQGSLVLAAEEERWSRRRHEWGAPEHSLDAALAHVRAAGGGPGDIVLAGCGWDFSAFAAAFGEEVLSGLPRSLGLLGGTGFIDARVVLGLPSHVGRTLGRRAPLITVPHHDAHAWGSLLLSPFHDRGEDVVVVVIDGMGDTGSTSIYLARDGRSPTRIAGNDSLFDSIGLFYQWLSSTQGGWAPLSSEGRFMGAAAWGDRNRTTNPIYRALQPMLELHPGGQVRLHRDWMHWHRSPRQPYGPPLEAVLGPPISADRLWDPDAVLDPHSHTAPELTARRLDVAAAVQMLFEDAVLHVVQHSIASTGAERVVWTGGTALNGVAAPHLAEALPQISWWTPPFPGDNGIAAGAALRLAWASGAVDRVEPLRHAFLGGSALLETDIIEAIHGSDLASRVVAADALPALLADWLVEGAILGLAQGQAETGPRALGHRSILADPRRADALERINKHVKRRESVRPLAPMLLAREAAEHFFLTPGTRHADDAAWRTMVRCARARPGTAERLPAIVHVDGTSRIQIVDPDVDPLVAELLQQVRARTGLGALVNTSLNVGAPIAHTTQDVLQTLQRARDLHGVVLVGELGRAWVVWDPSRPAGTELSRWVERVSTSTEIGR